MFYSTYYNENDSSTKKACLNVYSMKYKRSNIITDYSPLTIRMFLTALNNYEPELLNIIRRYVFCSDNINHLSIFYYDIILSSNEIELIKCLTPINYNNLDKTILTIEKFMFGVQNPYYSIKNVFDDDKTILKKIKKKEAFYLKNTLELKNTIGLYYLAKYYYNVNDFKFSKINDIMIYNCMRNNHKNIQEYIQDIQTEFKEYNDSYLEYSSKIKSKYLKIFNCPI